jgi:hypothetical protein
LKGDSENHRIALLAIAFAGKKQRAKWRNCKTFLKTKYFVLLRRKNN